MPKPDRTRSPRQNKKAGAKKAGAKKAGAKGSRGYSATAQPLVAVDFWFDPVCPWAWLTSRWILEVEQVRPVRTVFHVMSLAVLNSERDLDAGYRQTMNESWAPVRVALAIEEQYGQEQLAAFYEAIGTRIHPRGEGHGRSTIEAALVDIGLPPDLADVGDTGENDDALRRSHAQAMELVGEDVGTPVLRVHDSAIFGPVISAVPTGEEAGAMFDAVVRLSAQSTFFELKRSRTVGPSFG